MNRRQVLSLASAATIIVSSSCTAEAKADDKSRSEHFPLSGLAVLNGVEVTEAVRSAFQKSFGCSVMKGDYNPGCCIFVEHIGADLADRGWIFCHFRGGSILSCTSEAELLSAIDTLKKNSKQIDNRNCLPIGLYSSYPIHSNS